MTTEKHKLSVQTRAIQGRKVKQLRHSGQVPGNVFGRKIKSLSIQLDTKQFSLVFSKAGESSLVYLQLDKEKDTRPTFVSQVSRHPLTGEILHVSFHQVDLAEKVTAPVPLILVGESLAEKEKIGIQVQQLDEIEIEALPTNMPENIEIDVTELAQPGDKITVSDLKIDSTKLNVISDPELIIVQIEALAKEEVAPVVETPTTAEGEAATETAPEAAPAQETASPKEE